ncbi:MAG: hypothetical protein HQM11_07420 [SAR324 cluster bacterium]|nr:hypothetical protein [SAR324 cluster bacterium]
MSPENTSPEIPVNNRSNFWIREIRNIDRFWKEKSDRIYEQKLQLTDHMLVRINHLRHAFRFYILPLLEQLKKTSEVSQQKFFRYHGAFVSEKSFHQFMRHLYAVECDREGDWFFINRDPYEQDIYVLYDLYKVKKTIESVDALQTEIESGVSFPSEFQKERQISILKGFRGALMMAIRQSIKPEYHNLIYKNISPDYLKSEQLEHRRQLKLVYARPETVDVNPYRSIFLNLMFRQQIRTRVRNRNLNIHYSLVHFEQLKQEYLHHWVKRLDRHPEKQKIYQNLYFQGKTFSEWVLEDPEKEDQLLNQLPLETFNDTVAQLQQKVEPEKRSPVESLSEKSSVFKELNNNFQNFLNNLKPRLFQTDVTAVKQVLSTLATISAATLDRNTVAPTVFTSLDVNEFLPQTRVYRPGDQEKIKQVRPVLLLPKLWNGEFEQNLRQRLDATGLSAIISTPGKTNMQELEQASLILSLRGRESWSTGSEISTLPEQWSSEIVDAELPLSEYTYPDSTDFFKVDQWSQRFVQLAENITRSEQNKLLVAKYNEHQQLWKIQQSVHKVRTRLQQNEASIQELFPQYLTLLHWLLLEAIEEGGHLEKLVLALVRVSRCLIIDDRGEPICEHLIAEGFDAGLLALWTLNKLEKQMKAADHDPSSSDSIEAFLKNSRLDKYDLVVFTDWLNSSSQCLPVYLRLRQFQDKSSNFVRVYRLNLFSIFEDKTQLLKRFLQRRKEISKVSQNINYSEQSLELLRNMIFQHLHLTRRLLILEQTQQQLIKQFNTVQSLQNPTYVSQHVQQYLLNRTELFIIGHYLKFWKDSGL